MDTRNLILYWWPAAARVIGAMIGVYGAFVVPSVDKASVLAFAGALIVVPNIADAQRKRNTKRRINGDPKPNGAEA